MSPAVKRLGQWAVWVLFLAAAVYLALHFVLGWYRILTTPPPLEAVR